MMNYYGKFFFRIELNYKKNYWMIKVVFLYDVTIKETILLEC